MSYISALADILCRKEILPEIIEEKFDDFLKSVEEKAVTQIKRNRILPPGQEERIGYYLRAKALDEELSFLETGVAFLSLGINVENQIEGESSDIIIQNMREKGCRTVGEFLYITGPAGERIAKHSDLTHLYEAEFIKIWQKQSAYRPDAYDEDLKQEIFNFIFSRENK
jgi:hypothetical protein